jgi:arginase
MDLAIATGRGPDVVANLDNLRPLVREEDTVVFGYRDGEATEGIGENSIKSTQIYAQTLDAIRQVGVKQAAINALDRLLQKPLDGIWIHLDVDVLDDAIMPAVDYRMLGGMSFEELTEVLQVLIASPKAIGLEVTIFNPSLDPDGLIACALMNSLVAGLML